jgi:hypothetical protein
MSSLGYLVKSEDDRLTKAMATATSAITSQNRRPSTNRRSATGSRCGFGAAAVAFRAGAGKLADVPLWKLASARAAGAFSF